MNYSVSCPCGRNLTVDATQAGATTSCSCGESVRIPRLSALRMAAGETAVPLNPVERIQVAVQKGELPDNDLCPLTSRFPDSVAVFRIRCEKVWYRGSDSNSMAQVFLWFLLLGWIGVAIAMFRGRGSREALGRETSVDAPLRVSAEGLKQLSGWHSQRALKKLLSVTPTYAELFKQYPEAEVRLHSGAD